MSLGRPKFQEKKPRNRGNFLTKKRLHGGTPNKPYAKPYSSSGAKIWLRHSTSPFWPHPFLVGCLPLVHLTYHLAIVLPLHRPNDGQMINKRCPKWTWEKSSDFLFPLQPHPPHPHKPPRPSHPKKLDFGPFRVLFGSFRVRLAPFGSVSGLFRVRFGVLGGVGERGFCKGKEYH